MVAAVCDAGGNAVALQRDDDAYIASVDVASNKAFTAVSLKMTTEQVGRLAQPGAPLYGVQHTNQGRIVIFGGGRPLDARRASSSAAWGSAVVPPSRTPPCATTACSFLKRRWKPLAFEISEAQIEKIVEQVLRSLPDASAPAAQWDATGYGGRKFIGIFESMEAAIEATAAGYKALREMTVEQREKIITEIRRLTRAEAETMARLGVAETGMGRVEHKTAKHLLVADKTPGTEDIVSEARTGDHGLTLVEMAPFGLVGSITPSTNPSETVLCNSIGMVARGQRRGLQPSPPRHRHLELRRRPGQPGLQGGGRPRNSGLLGGQAHHGDRQGHADPSRHQAAGLHRAAPAW